MDPATPQAHQLTLSARCAVGLGAPAAHRAGDGIVHAQRVAHLAQAAAVTDLDGSTVV
ncbi:hypothetical protein [Streptomyces mexicanus]|uniref:hypothetical protein n=1 Tax=Streptomyces mexicanus TaxID=178566 RepID=UPI0036B78A48